MLAVALLVLAVPAVLENELQDTLDDSLVRRAADVAQLNATTPDQLTAPGALEGRFSGGTLFVQVIDREGRIVARSSALGGRDRGRRQRALRDRQPRFSDGALGNERLRVYTAPLGELGRGEAAGGAVVVAASLAEIDRTLDRTRRLVAICALAAAMIAAVLATLLTRRALRPLTRLSSGAKAIERSGDAAERLPEDRQRDEVGELADTLNAMLASLERAQEAEHRFVGDASHELRTPLTALRGNAAYIARHGADPEVIAEIEAGADAAHRAARRPARARPRGRRRAGQGRAGRAQGAGAGRGRGDRRATTSRSASSAPRSSARSRTSSATPASTGSGKVTITVGAHDGEAFLSVSDEGPGIPPHEARAIFDRFARGSAARGEGSGLGLAIVKAIAERHGGRVEVDGAKFTLAVKELSKSPRTTAAR